MMPSMQTMWPMNFEVKFLGFNCRSPKLNTIPDLELESNENYDELPPFEADEKFFMRLAEFRVDIRNAALDGILAGGYLDEAVLQ